MRPALAAFILLQPLVGQSQRPTGAWEADVTIAHSTITMYTDNLRCLASVIYTLSKKYGVRLTFEDAPLTSSYDLIDATAKTTKPQSLRILLPRGGPLRFSFALDEGGHIPARIAVAALLDAYGASGYPGRYQLNENQGILHIIPVEARNASGNWITIGPLMSHQVTLLPKQGRTNKAVLELLIGQIEAASGRRVVLGTPLSNTFENAPFEDAASLPARDILERMFSQTGGHRLWLLLYDATFNYYVLSIFPGP
jgi:hypothetical protein